MPISISINFALANKNDAETPVPEPEPTLPETPEPTPEPEPISDARAILSSRFSDDTVFDSGAARGEDAASIELSGTTDAADGTRLEGRAVSLDDDGATSTDWSELAIASGGEFSGSLAIPRSSSWYRGEVRVAGSTAAPAETARFGVGHVIALWGQSEIANLYAAYYDGSNKLTGETVNEDDAVVFWWHDRAPEGTGPAGVRKHVMRMDDGYNTRFVRMANALIAARPEEKFAVVLQTRSGSGFDKLVNDSITGRVWGDDLALHQAALGGGNPGLVLFDWHAAPRTYGSAYGEVLHQIAFGCKIDGTDIGPAPVSIDGRFTADHLLTELYDWTRAKLAVLEPHRYEPGNIANIGACRDATRAMYAASTEAALVTAPAALSYSNGRISSGSFTDFTHPSPGEGSRRYGENLMQSALHALGLRRIELPVIDKAYWEPEGNYVEVWSSQGPIRTIGGAPVGVQVNGTAYDATITNANRLRVTAAQVGRQLAGTDMLRVLPVSTGLEDIEESLTGWRQFPLVRAAWGARQISESRRAAATVVASKSELVAALGAATGGEDILVARGTDLGDLRLDNYTFASMVNVWSETVNGARLSQLYLTGNTNLTFRNFHIERGHDAGSNIVIMANCADVGVIGNTIYSDEYPVRGADYTGSRPVIANGIEAVTGNRNITVEGNYIGGVTRGLRLKSEGVVRVVGNMFEDCYDDPVQISQPSSNHVSTEISNNFFAGVLASAGDFGNPHADFVQLIGSSKATYDWPVTINGNVIIADATAQGIFLDDIGNGKYFIPAIENNLIVLPTGHGGQPGNGIKVGMIGEGSVIRRNTCVTLDPDGSETGGPGIVLGGVTSAGAVLVADNVTDASPSLLGGATYTETGNVTTGPGGATISYETVFGADIPNPATQSFNDAILRFVGRGDYAGIGADRRNLASILLDGLPVANDPEPAVLVNTLAEKDSSSSDLVGGSDAFALGGDMRIRDMANHATGTVPYTFKFRLAIDQTTGFNRLVYDNALKLNVEVDTGKAAIRYAIGGSYGLATVSDVFVPGVPSTFVVTADPATGAFGIYVDGELVEQQDRDSLGMGNEQTDEGSRHRAGGRRYCRVGGTDRYLACLHA